MSARCRAILSACVILVLVLLGAGCTSTAIGDISYSNGTIIIPVTCTGEPGDAFVQVTVYEIKDFSQHELTYLQVPVTLRQGANELLVTAPLPAGTYKLYVYVLKPGERQTATIRDIVV
jgi:hypothetical protein